MKTAGDVFELPLAVEFVGIDEFYIKNNSRHGYVILAKGFDEAYCTARAINNVDALADALGEALLQIAYLHNKHGETGSGNSVLSRGQAALDNYRGTK